MKKQKILKKIDYRLLKQVFDHLKYLSQRSFLPLKQEKTLLKKSISFHEHLLRNQFFQAFKRHMILRVRPHVQQVKKNEYLFVKKQMKKYFDRFKQNVYINKYLMKKAKEFYENNKLLLVNKIFQNWKQKFKIYLKSKKHQNFIITRFRIKKSFLNLACAIQVQKQIKLQDYKALEFKYIQMQQRYFIRIKFYLIKQKQLRENDIRIKTSKQMSDQKAFIQKWIYSTKQKQIQNQKIKKQNQIILKKYFNSLRNFYVKQKSDRLDVIRIQNNIMRQNEELKKQCFRELIIYVRKQKRNLDTLKNFQKRQQMHLYRVFFQEILRSSCNKYKMSYTKLLNKNQILNADIKFQTNEIENENQKIHQLTEINMNQDQQIQLLEYKLQKQEEQHNLEIQEMHNKLKNQDEKIQVLTLSDENKEQLINELQIQIMNQLNQDELIRKQLEQENHNLKRNQENVNNDLNYKLQIMEDQEQKHIEKINSYGEVFENLEIKLQSSINMATEFKCVIQEQNVRIKDLDSINQKMEQELLATNKQLYDCKKVSNSLGKSMMLKLQIIEYEIQQQVGGSRSIHAMKQINDLKFMLQQMESKIVMDYQNIYNEQMQDKSIDFNKEDNDLTEKIQKRNEINDKINRLIGQISNEQPKKKIIRMNSDTNLIRQKHQHSIDKADSQNNQHSPKSSKGSFDLNKIQIYEKHLSNKGSLEKQSLIRQNFQEGIQNRIKKLNFNIETDIINARSKLQQI